MRGIDAGRTADAGLPARQRVHGGGERAGKERCKGKDERFERNSGLGEGGKQKLVWDIWDIKNYDMMR